MKTFKAGSNRPCFYPEILSFVHDMGRKKNKAPFRHEAGKEPYLFYWLINKLCNYLIALRTASLMAAGPPTTVTWVTPASFI